MTLKAIFPIGTTELTVNGLHQWDYGRKLEIHAADLPAVVEIHFACPGMEEAIVRVGSAVGGVVTVAIPDRCLEQSAPITAWVYEVGETYGQTIKALTLNIMKRARPQVAETLTPEICDKYTEAVGAMNETASAMNEVVGDLKNGNIIVAKANKATQADRATIADKAIIAATYLVSDLDTLEDLIKDTPGSFMGLSIRTGKANGTGITIPTAYEDVYIPNWAYGSLTVDENGDASIHLMSYTGAVFHLWRNSANSEWVKGKIDAETANRIVLNKQNINDVPFEPHISGGSSATEVSIYEPGVYALFCRDELNGVNYSQVVYVYHLESRFSMPLKSGTHSGHLNFEGVTETKAAHFYAISTDLQYKFDIYSVLKVAGVKEIQW